MSGDKDPNAKSSPPPTSYYLEQRRCPESGPPKLPQCPQCPGKAGLRWLKKEPDENWVRSLRGWWTWWGTCLVQGRELKQGGFPPATLATGGFSKELMLSLAPRRWGSRKSIQETEENFFTLRLRTRTSHKWASLWWSGTAYGSGIQESLNLLKDTLSPQI